MGLPMERGEKRGERRRAGEGRGGGEKKWRSKELALQYLEVKKGQRQQELRRSCQETGGT